MAQTTHDDRRGSSRIPAVLGRILGAALGVGVALLAAGAVMPAFAGGTSDSASVGLRVYVVQAMSVRAEQPEIDVGSIAQGGRLEVDAAGDAEGIRASFRIQGSGEHRWRISVAYADLVGPAGRSLRVAAPGGSAVCFASEAGVGRCSPAGDDALLVDGHGGDGTAHVGYAVDVDEDAPAGAYGNDAAILLTAESLLNAG